VTQPWAWADIGAAAAALVITALILTRVARSVVSWRAARAVAAAQPDGHKRLLRGIKTKGSGVRAESVNLTRDHTAPALHLACISCCPADAAAGPLCLRREASLQHDLACLRASPQSYAKPLTRSSFPFARSWSAGICRHPCTPVLPEQSDVNPIIPT